MELQSEDPSAACAAFRDAFSSLRSEIGRVLVGQEDVVEEVLLALFANGHVLLEGVPGLGKTLLIQTLSETLALDFKRIQFTPDLMPADITGTSIVVENPATGHRDIAFREGPIFSQLVLADEINRASPKSQAALLEAMQERSVTAGGTTHALQRPFFVMATQNPIEQEGTYPLPEAQLDRFFFKLHVGYSGRKELMEIIDRTTSGMTPNVQRVLDTEKIIAYQNMVRQVSIPSEVQDYAVRLVLATHPDEQLATPQVKSYLRFGASPRAAQTLVVAGKVHALLGGRLEVTTNDIRKSVLPSLRHRCILNFEADAEGMTCDAILTNLIETLPATTS